MENGTVKVDGDQPWWFESAKMQNHQRFFLTIHSESHLIRQCCEFSGIVLGFCNLTLWPDWCLTGGCVSEDPKEGENVWSTSPLNWETRPWREKRNHKNLCKYHIFEKFHFHRYVNYKSHHYRVSFHYLIGFWSTLNMEEISGIKIKLKTHHTFPKITTLFAPPCQEYILVYQILFSLQTLYKSFIMHWFRISVDITTTNQ